MLTDGFLHKYTNGIIVNKKGGYVNRKGALFQYILKGPRITARPLGIMLYSSLPNVILMLPVVVLTVSFLLPDICVCGRLFPPVEVELSIV